MLVKNLKDYESSKAVFPCYASPKIDGVRGRFCKTLMYSRRNNRILGIAHIERHLKQFKLEVDGELNVPGQVFDDASGLIRRMEQRPEIVYNVFDLPLAEGPFYQRRLVLENLADTGFFNESVRLVPQVFIETEEQLMEQYHAWLDEGYEGLVCYDPESIYDGKRNYLWTRVIPFKSEDCQVIGFTPGGGKNVGAMGSLIVDYKGKECKVGTGFNEKQWIDLTAKEKLEWNNDEQRYNRFNRQWIWDHRTKLLGLKVKCEFKEETKAGVMRQPRFKGWRLDK